MFTWPGVAQGLRPTTLCKPSWAPALSVFHPRLGFPPLFFFSGWCYDRESNPDLAVLNRGEQQWHHDRNHDKHHSPKGNLELSFTKKAFHVQEDI